MPTQSIDYHDHTIQVTNDFMFYVAAGPTVSEDDKKHMLPHPFSSMREAKGEIDMRIALAAKTKKTKEAFKVAVLDGYGFPATIRGINAHTGDLLTDRTDASTVRDRIRDIAHHQDFYPDNRVIRDMLMERARLDDRTATLNAVLDRLAIRNNHGYGRIAIEKYDAQLAVLKDEIARVTKAAEVITTVPK